jgi:long-chain acyl-CoA synthetase
MSLLSLFHLQGFTCGFLVPLFAGVPTLPLDTDHKTTDVLNLMELRGVTHLISVPAVYSSLAAPLAVMPHIRSRIEMLVTGGIAATADLLETYQSKLSMNLCEGYGLTECSPVVTLNRPGRPSRHGTVGTPIACCEVKVTDAGGKPVPVGKEGEVLVRGQNLFRGYFLQPDKTKAVLSGGWFRTGDIGRLDADNCLTLTGLKKDMINVFGLKVYPKEVERILSQHEDIASLRIYPDNHEKYGSLVGCDLKVKPGRQLTERDFRRWCRQNISAYKIPRRVQIHD